MECENQKLVETGKTRADGNCGCGGGSREHLMRLHVECVVHRLKAEACGCLIMSDLFIRNNAGRKGCQALTEIYGMYLS